MMLTKWETYQLLGSVRSLDAERTVPFSLWRKNSSGILRKTTNRLRREELFTRFDVFLGASLPDAILSANLPMLRTQIQKLRFGPKQELFLPSSRQIDQIKIVALHGKRLYLYIFSFRKMVCDFPFSSRNFPLTFFLCST